jgi:hypothetical protein
VLVGGVIWGCARAPLVERVYEGHVVEGRYIEPEAYAEFLRGAIAEADGDTRGALEAYWNAGRIDPSGPEIWTRIASVRCAINPRDTGADQDLTRALAIDERYARAWAVKAQCSLARGDEVGARAAGLRAAELDPSADGVNVLLARASGPSRDASSRDALIALTVTARDRRTAWAALATWAEAHGDIALWASAFEALAKIDPARRESVARAAEDLAGAGEIGVARAVAAAAAAADPQPLSDEHHPLAARLALDEAIGRGDVDDVRRVTTRVRLGLEEAAARALLAGQSRLATDLALPVARADPSAHGARLVVAVNEGRELMGAALEVHDGAAPVSGASLVAFGMALVHTLSPSQARAVVAAIAHGPIVKGDDRVVRGAVELVSVGALDASALPADGIVELAALRGGIAGEGLSLPEPAELDARHEYLALALTHPSSPRARQLGARLARAAATDPVVAAAAAFAQLGTDAPIDPDAPRSLLARNPGDPLLAATALRLAEKIGDSDVARRARATLTALGAGSPQYDKARKATDSF